MVEYFVAYQAIDKTGKLNIGNIKANLVYPISEFEDIRKIEEDVKKECGFKSVIVTNYIKL